MAYVIENMKQGKETILEQERLSSLKRAYSYQFLNIVCNAKISKGIYWISREIIVIQEGHEAMDWSRWIC